ncbi:MAG: hypothetical protein AAFP90_22735 [Planctomycetota bacterium]
MLTLQITEQFFDRTRVDRVISSARKRTLSRMGAMIRGAARKRLRKVPRLRRRKNPVQLNGVQKEAQQAGVYK